MLQRIQSLFSLGFIVLTVVSVLWFSIDLKPEFDSVQWLADSMPYLLSLLSLISLMLFSKRTLQLRMNSIIIIVSFIFEIGLFFQVFQGFENMNDSFLGHFLLVFSSWAMLFLANRYIRKDEALIRSVDRLR